MLSSDLHVYFSSTYIFPVCMILWGIFSLQVLVEESGILRLLICLGHMLTTSTSAFDINLVK